MRTHVELKPEKQTLNGCLIRPAFRNPNGKPIGYLVTRGRRVVALVYFECRSSNYSRAAAWRGAIRFATGAPTSRDWLNSACASADGSPGPDRRQLKWLRCYRGRTLIGRLRRRDWVFTWPRATGWAPCPR